MAVAFHPFAVLASSETGEPEDSVESISVVVLDVQASGPVGPRQVEGLTTLLTSELANYRILQVISSVDVREMLGFEAQRQLLGCEDDACFAEIGGALGAGYLVSSEVSRFGTSWLFSLVVISLRDASPVRRLSVRKSTEDELLDELGTMVRVIASAILPEGGGTRHAAVAVGEVSREARRDALDEPPGDPATTTTRTRRERSVDLVPGARGRFGPEIAVRAGLSGHAAVLGLAAEVRATPWLGVAVGTGTHVLGGGFSIGGPAWRGVYLDGQMVLLRANPLTGYSGGEGLCFGATVGWELRPMSWLSVKAGGGYAWNTAKGGGGLLLDLMAGPVF